MDWSPISHDVIAVPPLQEVHGNETMTIERLWMGTSATCDDPTFRSSGHGTVSFLSIEMELAFFGLSSMALR